MSGGVKTLRTGRRFTSLKNTWVKSRRKTREAKSYDWKHRLVFYALGYPKARKDTLECLFIRAEVAEACIELLAWWLVEWHGRSLGFNRDIVILRFLCHTTPFRLAERLSPRTSILRLLVIVESWMSSRLLQSSATSQSLLVHWNWGQLIFWCYLFKPRRFWPRSDLSECDGIQNDVGRIKIKTPG